jgi:uracil-DNA glycosylase family 4
MNTIVSLQSKIIRCSRCPRLVRWREEVAREKVKRFADQAYWGKPLPSFGDPEARLLLVGLAPAAHGGNRTGRMFTGDESGNWLFRALHKAGFANQSFSVNREDGLRLFDCYITAAVRCVPPGNKPLPEEMMNCRAYLLREIELLKTVRVVVGLGRIGFEAAVQAYRSLGRIRFKARPKFAHANVYAFDALTFIASYHPSQQNTFTGKLTESMFDRIFAKAKARLQ